MSRFIDFVSKWVNCFFIGAMFGAIFMAIILQLTNNLK